MLGDECASLPAMSTPETEAAVTQGLVRSRTMVDEPSLPLPPMQSAVDAVHRGACVASASPGGVHGAVAEAWTAAEVGGAFKVKRAAG